MDSLCKTFHVQGCISPKPPPRSPSSNYLDTSSSSTLKPLLKEPRQAAPMRIDVLKTIKNASRRLLDAFVDSTFQFVDQPLLPTQSNFAPVSEIGEPVAITSIEGEIPVDFPEGVYIRNGPNPVLGALQSTTSLLGRSSETWLEGEGMLHALHFRRDPGGGWKVSYNNRYVESETFKIAKELGRPTFLPALEGDSPAILAAHLLNQLRYGKLFKHLSNTSVFEHAGRCYSAAESHIPQQIDSVTLKTLGDWDFNGAWDRPFIAHPKRVPGSGELVITGFDFKKPYLVLGVISADGRKLTHKVDLKLKRSILCHDIGVTEKYNIILDMPLILDLNRLIKGGPLIKYEKESYARIGVMPCHGDAYTIKWFEVEPYCTFHILNCYEEGEEVIVRGCRAPESIIPGPDLGVDKFRWFSRGFRISVTEGDQSVASTTEEGYFFSRLYEWRLNMKTGVVKGRYLTGRDFSLEFPMVHEHFVGVQNKFAYMQVVDSEASSICALAKYGRLAKLYLAEEQSRTATKHEKNSGSLIKIEHYLFGKREFCSGAAFVPKPDGLDEDDGWLISFVHNEESDTSQVHIIGTEEFESEAIAKITLPQRVPYGFHGTFIARST